MARAASPSGGRELRKTRNTRKGMQKKAPSPISSWRAWRAWREIWCHEKHKKAGEGFRLGVEDAVSASHEASLCRRGIFLWFLVPFCGYSTFSRRWPGGDDVAGCFLPRKTQKSTKKWRCSPQTAQRNRPKLRNEIVLKCSIQLQGKSLCGMFSLATQI